MSPAPRRRAREVRVGPVVLGGSHPVRVQSMTNTPTADVAATLGQVRLLEAAGCEMVRLAVSSRRELKAFEEIRTSTALPLIADIQYNHRFAVEALRLGADKVRVNPGNIGGEADFLAVLEEAGKLGRAVRVGINSGSIETDLLEEFGGPTPEAMMASLRRAVASAERAGFRDLVVSLKSSSVTATIAAYRLAARETDYPIHLGVTEAGGVLSGTVKSSIGMGILLNEGIGDTLRVSLTAPPETEVKVAWDILRALDVRRRGPEIIACPTCSRCQMDIISMVEEVERRLAGFTDTFTVAVMGCYVNGPGEAREADVGLAGGAGRGAIFRKGKVVREVPESECLAALMEEIREMTGKGNGT
jgi:(E)-4-hydroxy-3-methylbut-2-enyl-diphosphate synthase